MNVRLDTVEMADGRVAEREVVEHAAVVAIVPVDADGNVILVRQYRLPAEEALLEVPAGGEVTATHHYSVTLGSKFEIVGGDRRV